MKTALFIGAHPDDIEFGLGALIHRLTSGEARVVCQTLTTGTYLDLGGKPQRPGDTAVNESRRALHLLGAKAVEQNDFAAQHLPPAHEVVRAIEKVIVRHSVDAVFVHWHGDTHQDHRAAHHAALAAARRCPSVYGYGSGLYALQTAMPFAPQKYFAVSREDVEAKISAGRAHSSEWEKYEAQGVDPEKILLARAQYHGLAVGAEFAEPVVVYRERS